MLADSPVLCLQGISKSFGGILALKDVDFTLNRAEIHGLVGENGAGKSTLMKIIAGAQTDYQGTFLMDGAPVRFRSTHDALRAGIGMVHQELSIAPALSVAENMFLGRLPISKLGIVDWRRMIDEAAAHLTDLGIHVDPRSRIGTLGLGLQQLVELGRVLFSGARIVILDEPTSALSPPETRVLFDALELLRQRGTSLIFISHFLDDVRSITDSLTVIRNGRNVAATKTTLVDKTWIIAQMLGSGRDDAGREDIDEAVLPELPKMDPTLEVKGLVGGGLRDVSFDVAKGEILGVYGFMGSGHSEIGKALVGKFRLIGGTVTLNAKRVHLRNTAAAKKVGIACLPESRKQMLFSAVPIYKNLSVSLLERLSRIFLRSSLERQIATDRVSELDVRPKNVNLAVGTLSGGNQQKVALGRWLTHLPRVLILNEPTRGMDVGAKADVVNIVRLLKQRGVAVILVSTEPELVLTLADRIVVMKKGTISHEFSGETVKKSQLLATA